MAGGVRHAFAAVIAALILASPSSAAAPVPADFPGVYPSKHDTFDPKRRAESMDLQARIGVGTLRIPFDWSQFERQPGVWDFSAYDPIVSDAAARGLRILPILFDPPAFRSSRGAARTPGMYPPADNAAMAEFARRLVGRYGPEGSLWAENPSLPKVPLRSWQVWNEPNIPAFSPAGADPEAYTRLLEAVARALRAADPGAEVVAAGLPNSSYGPSIKTYLQRMYAAGANEWFDTLAIHPYGADFYDVMAQIHEMREIATRNGDDAPIWVTELGWPTDGPRGYDVVSRQEQARLVTQTFRGLAANRKAIGLRGFTYFYWRESARDPASTAPDSIWGHVGLIAHDGPKPAFYAFADILAEMLGRDRVVEDPGDPGPGGGEDGTREGDPACGDACADPSLGRLTVSPGAFRAAASGSPLGTAPKCSRPGGRSKRGACVSVRVSRAAPLLVELERLDGKRPVRIGKATMVAGRAGLNRLWLSGRSTRGRLRPGVYRMVVAPLDAAGRRATPASRRFRVLAEPRRSRR